MSIFSRNKSTAKATLTPANEAKPLQLVQDPSGNRTLALGMTWRTVMVTGGNAVALRMAREAKASHFCQVDGQAVGYGTLAGASRKQKLPAQIYPAALVAGHNFGGDAVFALKLSDTEAWVVSLRNGIPNGVEEILSSTEDIPLEEMLGSRIRELNDQLSESSLYTDFELEDLGDIEVVACSLNSLLEIPPRPTDKLIAIEKKGSFDGLKIPTPMIAMGVIGLITYGAWTGYTRWEAHKAAEARAKEAARVAREENPEVVWKAAFEKFRMATPHPSVSALKTVRDSFRNLPAQWMGWSIKTATCKAAPLAGGKQVWTCVANYDMTELVGAATNAQLKPTVPQGFMVNFIPTKVLNLNWTVNTEAAPIKLESLLVRSEHLVGTASKIQVLLPALNDAPTMVFAPVKMEAPRGKKTNAVIPMPAHFQLPSFAKLTIKGPLRSIDTVLARGIDADWQSLTFVYNKSSRAGGRSATDIRQSAMQVEINGVVYAKD